MNFGSEITASLAGKLMSSIESGKFAAPSGVSAVIAFQIASKSVLYS